MPVTPTYPGVYIEEVPSEVRTIIGVATSITAFIGRALRGPVHKAVTLNSYADFERIFGGLWVESSLGYAVRDFYRNGGSQAIVVRLYHAETGAGAKPAKTKVSAGSIKLEAAYEGKWGANLRASVDTDVSEDVALRMGLTKADLFNFTVKDAGPGGTTERFLNLSFKNSPRRIDKVLEAESKLARWDSVSPIDPNTPPAIAAADDDVTNKEKQLAAAKKIVPPVLADIAAAETAVKAAKKALDDAVSDGLPLTKAEDFTPVNAEKEKKGLYALEQADLFNLLCIPPYLTSGDVDPALIDEAIAYCEKRRALLLIDPPTTWNDKDRAKSGIETEVGAASKNAAIFFPRLRQANPLRDNQREDFAPCGAVVGLFARTDTARGVWKAPAGLEAALVGVPQLKVSLTDNENGELNPKGINCLRSMPAAWSGVRTRGWAMTASLQSGNTFPSAAWRSTSKRASIVARSGSSSSRTMSRCGRGPSQHRCVYAQSVSSRRIPGQDAARGVPGEMR